MNTPILLSPITHLPGIGSKIAKAFEKEHNIVTCIDLLSFYPYKYIDRTKMYKVRDIAVDMPYIQLRGVIRGFAEVGSARKKRLTALFSDNSGTIELIWFRSIAQIQRMYTLGKEYVIFGKPTLYNGAFSITHPEIEEVDKAVYSQTFMPVYVSTDRHKKGGLSNRNIRTVIRVLLDNIGRYLEDPLPLWVRQRLSLMDYLPALYSIHIPTNANALQEARRRMKFEELFFIQISLQQMKIKRSLSFVGYKFEKVGKYFNTLYKEILPFELTSAQKRVIKEIYRDCKSASQMNRLVQGDVGSGKTLVALFSMLLAIDNGYQACMMAPTEILARQHYQSIVELTQTLGLNVRVLTGSTSALERREILAGLKSSEINILIGTHAIIEDNVEFDKLGIAIIDEQHRFGVEQRARLWSKNSKVAPHILIMSATPIPRTLAMTLYGDLDVSVIDELPQGRKPIATYHHFEDRMFEVFKFIQKEVAQGRQVYVVYPMIEENETQDFKDLETGLETFKEVMPSNIRIAMVHGKMKPKDKDETMLKFKNHEIDILLSTTVIEVGVNVPNASVMVIESANRFGLSQLHQLRGRVGRGALQSYCILVTKRNLGNEALKRIQIMVETNDGFEIAEEDMRIRGFGDIDGTRQSGQAFNLHIANLAKDGAIVQISRDLTQELFTKDPELSNVENQCTKHRLDIINYKQIDWSNIS